MPRPPEWERRLACRDATGREAQLSVTVRDGKLILLAPPGESAVLTADQAAWLGRVLGDVPQQRDS